jgi:hypothetical protein
VPGGRGCAGFTDRSPPERRGGRCGTKPTPPALVFGRILIAIGLVVAGIANAAPEPGVFLFGATVDEARDFAVESASARGWSVPAIGPSTVELEQTLDQGDPDDPLASQRVIRISALFTEETAGTRVLLRAREVEVSATGDERTTDVTERYAENLGNALASLGSKWDVRREANAIGRQPAGQASASRDAISGSDAATATVGTWAYYAERYAASRGCTPTDSGAILETSGPEWEQHRVTCRDGGSLRVHCRLGDCTTHP